MERKLWGRFTKSQMSMENIKKWIGKAADKCITYMITDKQVMILEVVDRAVTKKYFF